MLRRIIFGLLIGIIATGATAGAGTVGPKRALLANIPSWVLTNASSDCDFQNSRCWTPSTKVVSPSSLLSISRASTGYAQTSAGTLVSFGSNVLRITDQGLLIEEPRTNLNIWSNDPTHFAGTNIVTVANALAGPDGATTAGSVADNSTSALHQAATASISFTSGTTYVLSGYFKASTATVVQLTFGSATFSGVGYADFDLSGGTVSSTGGTLAGSGIQALGNGWYRCWISAVATGSGSSIAAFLLTNNVTNAVRSPNYSGSGELLYMWGVQVEAGAFVTSAIQTTGASATRAADIITLSGAALTVALASQSLRTETNLGEGSSGVLYRIASWSDNTHSFRFNSGLTAVQAAFGANAASATFGSGTYAGIVKSAFGYDGTSFTAVANGGTKVSSANSWSVPTGNFVVGGVAAGTIQLNGYLRRLTFGNTKGQFDGLTQ